jgi:hypothetical protein
MKTLFSVALLLLLASNTSFASEGQDRGGGDLCEKRIQDIRNDIASWIAKGGHNGLSLSNLAPAEYASLMLQAIGSTKISCVSPGDKGYPVQVNSTPKECRFDKKGVSAVITCDKSKFEGRSESDQYTLIHHEYAGISQLEKPDGDISNYWISRQISGYLADVVIKKLVVKDAHKANAPSVDLPFPSAADGWVLQPGDNRERSLILSDAIRKMKFKNCLIKNLAGENESLPNFRFVSKQGGDLDSYAFVADPTKWNGGATSWDYYVFFNRNLMQMQTVFLGTFSYQGAERNRPDASHSDYLSYIIQFDPTLKSVISVRLELLEIYKENSGTLFEPRELLKKRITRAVTCLAE